MLKGSCLILQSGGPTTVINSSLYGVIRECKKHPTLIDNIYGCLNGIDGVFKNTIIDLNQEDEEELRYLTSTPGAILGSARHLLPKDLKEDEYTVIYSQIKVYNIRYLFLIGGNDSMDTANKLNKYFKSIHYECRVIGVPKTIDNDLVETDHCPGYGSAMKYVATSFLELEADISCYQKGRVTIVEVMGRDAGWLTAGSKLASLNGEGPDLIYLPEIPFDINKFLEDVNRVYTNKHHAIVAVSEGIKDENGNYITNSENVLTDSDSFGHVSLGGVSDVLCNIVSSRLKLPVRSIGLSIPQRCASHLTSFTDVDEAYLCGRDAVMKAIEGQTGVMVAMQRRETEHYFLNYVAVDLDKVANKVKPFPDKWIIDGDDISKDFFSYAVPLIQGENHIPLSNSLPRYSKLKKIKVNLVD